MALRRALEALAATTAPPDIDPEIADFGDGVELGATARSAPVSKATAGPRSRLRARADADAAVAALAAHPKYAGKVTAVAALRAAADSSESEEESVAGDGSSVDGSESEEEDAPSRPAPRSAGSSRLADLAPGDAVSRGGDEDDDVDAELFALEAAEMTGLASARAAATEEAEKGRVTRAQLALTESLLEARIKAQPVMQAAVRVPGPAVLEAVTAQSHDARMAATRLRTELAATLCDLLRAQAALLAGNAEVAAAVSAVVPASDAAAAAGRKRRRSEAAADVAAALQRRLLPATLAPLAKRHRGDAAAGGDEEEEEEEDTENGGGDAFTRTAPSTASRQSSDALWSALSLQWSAPAAWRDATLDKWGRRLLFASGANAKQAAKLKVLRADLSQQLRNHLRDMPTLVARTRPRMAALVGPDGVVGSARVLCEPSAVTEVDDHDGSEGLAAASSVDETGANVHAYDDGDGYQVALREYVALSTLSGASADADALAAAAAASKHKRTKREVADRRASKGRRLKYTVHPALAHFAAPTPYIVPPDLAFDVDAVVASLFQSA